MWWERFIGQFFGLTIGCVAIIAGAYTAVNGAQVAGAFIGTAGVTGLVAVFVMGRTLSGRRAALEDEQTRRDSVIAQMLAEQRPEELADGTAAATAE